MVYFVEYLSRENWSSSELPFKEMKIPVFPNTPKDLWPCSTNLLRDRRDVSRFKDIVDVRVNRGIRKSSVKNREVTDGPILPSKRAGEQNMIH